ncbi:hypothetical protein OJ996_04555 [Luteolibacter sp. GHJ8]|uniref:DUF4129 domain-containing protein n=1 Tax=Luteolibacter rhizosphaerae TaxID=2989719 RepID=A0ABT3G0S5_9BACT|nr:hypothetical protein [Luteolibacter rhizosphaerae]MCW1912830.1 hypothetical protein [Luteolibacter rhizosphaerae]
MADPQTSQEDIGEVTEVRDPSLVSLSIENGQVVMRLDWALILLAIVGFIFWVVARSRSSALKQEIDSVTIKFGGLPEAVIKINRDTQKIAFAAYAELVTRKIALPFDEDHDVIEDVYKSWYQVFSTVRDLIKQIPAHHLTSSEDTRELVQVLINLLNQGLRPHLTKWHSRYRRWYAAELENNKDHLVSPQEVLEVRLRPPSYLFRTFEG